MRLFALIAMVFGLAACAGSVAPTAQAGIPAFGASDLYKQNFPAVYDEPRACISSQEWWLEGAGDVTTSIADAMKAKHLHYDVCFPLMELWNESSGQLRLDVLALAHEYQGGYFKSLGGLGFLDNSNIQHKFEPVWRPQVSNEHKAITLVRATSTLKRCGRVESRNHLEGISPNGQNRQFNSNGLQSLFECKTGRTSASDRGPSIIFRGWYQNADYCNVTFKDDFRGEVGFRASQMDAPVIGDLRLSIQNGSCSNVRWFVSVNPNIHEGSFGSWKSQVFTSSGGTVTIPNSAIPSGEFKVLAAACERVGNSSANPIGGQNCGVGVIPFLGDGA